VVISTIPFPRRTWRDSSPLVVLFGGNRNYKHVPWDSKGPFQPINEILRDIRLLARMERNYQYVPPPRIWRDRCVPACGVQRQVPDTMVDDTGACEIQVPSSRAWT
jgi:hypothetical protein